MSPSHARKKGVRYRYYISLPLMQGQPDRAGTIHRVPAVEIERVVGDAVRAAFDSTGKTEPRALIAAHVKRVEVQPERLAIEIKTSEDSQESDSSADGKVIHVPWQKPPSKRRREIFAPPTDSTSDQRPIRADARARLIAAIARGRRWLAELTIGSVTSIEAIAKRERCSVRKINMTISLAFLAPDLVKAAMEGCLPRGVGLARLCDPPAEWSGQYRNLGLTAR